MNKLLFLPTIYFSVTSFTQAEDLPNYQLDNNATPSWDISAEALYLKAEANDFGYQNQDFEFAYRLKASYKDGDRTGIRLSHFSFEGTQGNSFQEQGPEIDIYDLEFFNQYTDGGWTMEYALGIRYFDYSENFIISGLTFTDANTDAWGPTFQLEFTKEINQSFTFYTKGRVSYVFGDESDLGGGGDTLILELGTGIQYNFNLANQTNAYIRCGLEVQQYDDVSVDIDGALTDSGVEDGLLFGGSLSFGIQF